MCGCPRLWAQSEVQCDRNKGGIFGHTTNYFLLDFEEAEVKVIFNKRKEDYFWQFCDLWMKTNIQAFQQ